MTEYTNITIRCLLIESRVESRLRDAERRWKSSGNVKDHLAYLKEVVRSGDTFEMIGLDGAQTILPEFQLKDMTYDGNSLNDLVARIERVIKDRITPWAKNIKVKVTAIKWIHPGANDAFIFLCDIKFTKPTRLQPRSRIRTSGGTYTYSWDEQAAYGGDETTITMRYNFAVRGALEGLFAGRPAPWAVDGPEGVLRNFRMNPGIVLYSTVSSIPKR